ncbi:MAG TPA: FtsX-like permease family protein [Acidimicrobiales bacterium]|nr:FtsX-like permease family protein [Acidimicrobiales bacterium]
MFRTTLANLARRKLRLLATSLAVLLGVMFTSGTLVLTDSLQGTFDNLFSNVYANTSAVVRSNQNVEGGVEFGATPTRGTMPDSRVAEVVAAKGVADAEGAISGYAQIVKSDGKALGNPNQGPPTMGGNWMVNTDLNPYRVVQGHAPKTADEIVTDISSAADAGYRVGDEVRLLTPTGDVTKTLVGLTKFGDADSAGGSTMVQFTFDEAQKVLTKPGVVDEIWVAADPGVSQIQVVRNIEAEHLTNTEVLTGTDAAQEAKDMATSFLSFFSVFLLVFAAIALLVGAFIIANTFSILVAQRTRELALLRAIGASRRQVLASVVSEAAVVGVIASAIGLGLGFVIASGLQRALMGDSSLASGTTLTPRTVIASFVIGIGITVLSALLPARKAARVPPVTALRDAAIEDTSHSRIRSIIGAVLLVVAALALIGAATSNTAALVGVGAIAGLIGAVVFGPALAGAIARLTRPLVRSSGMAGHLGIENVLRNPRRTASTASALMIGATLVCAISVFAASAIASINDLVDTGFNGDVVVTSTGNGIPLSDIDRVAETEGVATVAALEYGPATVDGKGTLVSATDPAALASLVDMKVSSGDLAKMGTGDVAVSESYAKSHGLKVGSTVETKLLDGSSPTWTVRAIYRNPLVAQNLLTSPETVKGSLLAPVAQIAFVDAASGVSTDALVKNLETTFSKNPTAKVQTNDGFKKSAASQMDTFLTIVYAMLALAVIIAIIGIVNTLGLSILERTRELGLLRAVGMTRRQLRKTVRIEALLIAMTGTIIGLVLGTAIGAALIKSFGPDQALTGFAIPWIRLTVVLIAGVIVGFIAAALPTRRATHLDPLDALASD